MKDTELYRHLLGLEPPWTVSRVELDTKGRRVSVWAEHAKEATFVCPECSKACGLYDHEAERTWRHLDSCHFETHLHARVPRVECPHHGIRQTTVPWAEPRSRFTLLFERFAIDVLLESDIAGSARVLGISWDEAHGIMQRAVERGLSRREVRVPGRIGIDEKALSKGHRYATLVNDLEHGVVVEVAEGRTKESLYTCLGAFSMNELAQVEAIAMDMWEPFLSALKDVVAGAEHKVVFDRFHIIGHMNQALDQVRRAENKTLRAEGDDRLVGTKYLWLYAAENVPEHRKDEFWSLRKVAAMIVRHLPNVLTYFEHRITNAASESINSIVRLLQKRAFGFRSFPNFRTAILFRCGGLNLYPATHPIVR